MHYLVKTTGVARSGVTEFNAATVQFQPATLPAPPRDAGNIRFRAGLTLEAIQQGLQYFCNSIFGYEKTKYFQNLVFQRVFSGQHVLGISATGSGKSLCFWLPALLRPRLTLIICPLRSLDARPAFEFAQQRHRLRRFHQLRRARAEPAQHHAGSHVGFCQAALHHCVINKSPSTGFQIFSAVLNC